MFSGDNPLQLERTINGSVPAGGYFEDLSLPVPSGIWTNANGVALAGSAGATPYIATTNTNLRVIRWRQDAAATDILRLQMPIPGQYNPIEDKVRLLLCMRKTDASTDENADLRIQVNYRWVSPGLADPTIASTTVPSGASLVDGDSAITSAGAVVGRTLAAPSATLVKDFVWYQYDLSYGTTERPGSSAANEIKPSDVLVLEIGPHETLGSTDMTVDLLGAKLRFNRHASLANVLARMNPAIIR